MKVHLIRKETIEEFGRKNAQSRGVLREWLSKLKFSDWNDPADIQDTFRSADLLDKGSNRVVFDIGGNKYRMICKYAFGEGRFTCLFAGWEHLANTSIRLCDDDEQYSTSIPEEFHGEVMDACFQFLEKPSTPVAIKAFSLTTLFNLSKQYPEIKPELKLIRRFLGA